MVTISFEELCRLNSTDGAGEIVILPEAIFPDTEFRTGFSAMLYSTKGCSEITIDGKDYLLRRKCISVWRPGQVISFRPTQDFSYKVLLISGTLNEYLNINSAFLTLFVADDYPVIRITSAYQEAVERFFESISIVSKFQNNPYKRDCQISLLRALFYSTGYYVFRSLRIQNEGVYSFVQKYPANDNSKISQFINLVERYSAKERRLSFYAEKMEYNPKYLSAMVKRETGHSGQQVIDYYSILAAMSKLSYGHQSIKELSEEMNFQSQSDFGKFFKRITGQSPLSYRKSRFMRLR